MTKQKAHTLINKNSNANERIEIVHSGKDYFSRLHKIILNSKSELHLQTYIFDDDDTGKKVVAALLKAAARNVKIYVLLDSYGSKSLSHKFTNNLIKNGINFRFFSPFFSSNNFYLGRRLHHKVVVADNHIALIGGINISNKYRVSDTTQPWLDYAVEIESEIIAQQLNVLCRKFYFKNHHIYRRTKHPFHSLGEASIRIIQNDWLKQKNDIGKAYIKSISNAQKEVIIVGAYFFPNLKLTNALKKVSRKGVKIKLILSGVSDIPVIKNATSYLYSKLLHLNIELYEWNKSVLHGKAAVIDNEWATVGSFNLNHLSSYGSIEMNVEIKSKLFSENLSLHLNKVIYQCENITLEKLKTRRGIFIKFRNWLSYQLLRMAFAIVTYLPYKRFKRFY